MTGAPQRRGEPKRDIGVDISIEQSGGNAAYQSLTAMEKGIEMNTGLKITSISAAALLLAACGNTAGERGVSGGAIGAGVGAAGAAVTGGSVVTGAVLGGAAGAATGVLTDEDDINLD